MSRTNTNIGLPLHLNTPKTHHVMVGAKANRAKPYSLKYPYASIQDCFDLAYVDGDIIFIHSGSYNEEDILFTVKGGAVSHVDLVFEEGAIITASTVNTEMFNSTGVTYSVYGRGEFIHDNAGNGNVTTVFQTGTACYIYGAKRIYSETGVPLGVRTSRVENVDIVESGNNYAMWMTVASNPLRNGRDKGVFRNTYFKGFYAVSVQNPVSESVLFENCHFESFSNYIITNLLADSRATFNNCTFKGTSATARGLLIGGYLTFNNCKIESAGAGLETILISPSPVTDRNNPRIIFNNCDIKNIGTGPCVRSTYPAIFNGLNKIQAVNNVVYGPVRGLEEAENIINGTVVVNTLPLSDSVQTWRFFDYEDPPTVGETYTINSPEGGSISYIVQVADTVDDVIDGLIAAWQAEAIADPDGQFAKYNDLTPFYVSGNFQAAALDPLDNFDGENGFTVSTSGTDTFDVTYIGTEGFGWKGFGKFVVNDDLLIPNID